VQWGLKAARTKIGRHLSASILLLLAASWLTPPASAAGAPLLDGKKAAATGQAHDGSKVNPTWRWRLSGTLIGPSHRTAVFATVGETRAVEEGEQIDGWTVTAVSPGEVTLTASNSKRILSLEGFSPEETAEAAWQRAELAAGRNAEIRAALTTQEREIAASNDALLAATKEMQAVETSR